MSLLAEADGENKMKQIEKDAITVLERFQDEPIKAKRLREILVDEFGHDSKKVTSVVTDMVIKFKIAYNRDGTVSLDVPR